MCLVLCATLDWLLSLASCKWRLWSCGGGGCKLDVTLVLGICQLLGGGRMGPHAMPSCRMGTLLCRCKSKANSLQAEGC